MSNWRRRRRRKGTKFYLYSTVLIGSSPRISANMNDHSPASCLPHEYVDRSRKDYSLRWTFCLFAQYHIRTHRSIRKTFSIDRPWKRKFAVFIRFDLIWFHETKQQKQKRKKSVRRRRTATTRNDIRSMNRTTSDKLDIIMRWTVLRIIIGIGWSLKMSGEETMFSSEFAALSSDNCCLRSHPRRQCTMEVFGEENFLP